MNRKSCMNLWPRLRAGLPALLLGLCLGCFFAPAALMAAAPGADAPELVWQADGFFARAFQDRPGSMAAKLFSGPASAEERAAYFVDGSAPSSISVFSLTTPDGLILFDAGFGDLQPPYRGGMSDLVARGLFPVHRYEYVFMTHMHMDHAGGLLREGKRVFPKAKILVSKPELDYWLELARTKPDNANAALVKRVVEAYGEDLLAPFSFGDTLPGGIEAIDASGHTPGHTVFLVRGKEDGKEKALLILGDLLHAAALQFPLPDECASYDIDAPMAAKTRKRILDMAAEQNMDVAGMHIPFPGAGQVSKDGKGYKFTPNK
ncbi:MBL fold metallo-hydrolase [Desulfovibrio sp. OttesenSCG-928-A18]|nr:MBL fold metallo-hydrolase [Desulfovibrio sp. OttesenSCG-928-A18]